MSTGTSQSDSAPRSSRHMTFGELLARPSTTVGTCRFCKAWHTPGRYYGIRHALCEKCCESRREEALPSVLKSERAARAYANRLGDPMSAQFISHLAGVTLVYAEWALAHRKPQNAKTDGRGIAV